MIKVCDYQAECGTVLVSGIKSSTFGVSIANHYGDGSFSVYALDKDEKVPDGADFETCVYGSFSIHRDDWDIKSPIVADFPATNENQRRAFYAKNGDIFITEFGVSGNA